MICQVRDEAELMSACLKSLSLFVDAIVILDDCSTDGSGQVARNLALDNKIERVERSPHCTISGGKRNKALFCAVMLFLTA